LLQGRSFEWDQSNYWKPEKHGISLDEVEEVFFNRPLVRKGRDKRYYAYGQSDSGKYIIVVFVYKGNGKIRPITARMMAPNEKNLYQKG